MWPARHPILGFDEGSKARRRRPRGGRTQKCHVPTRPTLPRFFLRPDSPFRYRQKPKVWKDSVRPRVRIRLVTRPADAPAEAQSQDKLELARSPDRAPPPFGQDSPRRCSRQKLPPPEPRK